MSRKYIKNIRDLETIYLQSKPLQLSRIEKSDMLQKEQEGNIRSNINSNGGLEILSDKGQQVEQEEGKLQSQWWLSKLTKRQQKLIKIMQEEKKRRIVAKRMGVCLQAVNQMIIRVRQRIEMYEAMS